MFLNGIEIAKLAGHSNGYLLMELGEKAMKALRPGKNVLAIHVKQVDGGQYIDAGLTDEVETR